MTRILALLLVLLLALPASAQVRRNIDRMPASELADLRRGVSVMMSRNNAPRDSAAYRTSWEFWANMHGHFGADCAGRITGSGMTGVRARTASNTAERDTWCQCEHRSDRFLTWHRIFLAHFERVLAAASGNPNLRLPYWDGERLPDSFRVQTVNGRANPLYRPRPMNDGRSLSAAVRSSANAMAATTYSQFNSRMEASPHGAIHCAVAGGCPNGLMGNLATAALDPIFWLHHSRIDRDYEGWLRSGGRIPTAGRDVRYSMVTPGGSVVSARVGDWLRLQTPYDSLPTRPAQALAADGGTTIKPRTVTITILSDPAPGATYRVVWVSPHGSRTTLGVIGGFEARPTVGGHSGDRVYDFTVTRPIPDRPVIEFTATTGIEGAPETRADVIAGVVVSPSKDQTPQPRP